MKTVFIASILSFIFLTSQASAEEIFVKYRGNIPLDNFECPDIKPSSLVKRICYDHKNLYLIVKLKSTYYHYCGLPKSTLDEWKSSKSLGRYYLQNVKSNANNGLFDCRNHIVPKY